MYTSNAINREAILSDTTTSSVFNRVVYIFLEWNYIKIKSKSNARLTREKTVDSYENVPVHVCFTIGLHGINKFSVIYHTYLFLPSCRLSSNARRTQLNKALGVNTIFVLYWCYLSYKPYFFFYFDNL